MSHAKQRLEWQLMLIGSARIAASNGARMSVDNPFDKPVDGGSIEDIAELAKGNRRASRG